MSNQNGCGCGCGPDSPKPDMFLMAASPSSASTCGTGQTPGEVPGSTCLLSDPTYDVTTGDFVIPIASASIVVCNAALYTLGQWIQFVHDGSVLQIISIAGNTITLRNSCVSGEAIQGNSPAGTPIPTGSPFVVVSEPPCTSPADMTAAFEQFVAGAQKLCMPALTPEPSSTAKMQILGWLSTDSVPNFGKCIHWLSGIWRQGASFFIKPITMAPSFEEPTVNAWRPMVINKTTGEVREQKNPMESANIGTGKWVPAYDSSFMYMVGPAYIFSPIPIVNVYKNNGVATTLTDASAWPVIAAPPTEFTQVVNLAAHLPLNAPDDKVYAVIQLNFAVDHNGTGLKKELALQINGVERVAVACAASSQIHNSCILLIEMPKIAPTFSFKVINYSSAGGAAKYLVSMDLLGFQL